MLTLANTNATVQAPSRLNIGGISVQRTVSPKFRLKIETNLDVNGNSPALDPQQTNGIEEQWNDPLIMNKRIPKEELQLNDFLGHGSFGHIYWGQFRDEKVTVEKLQLQSNEDEKVKNCLAAVKVMTTLNHCCIVRFLGVTWTPKSNLCVVQEVMENGDLRSMLDKFEANQHPIGFDRKKTEIAMQICSALTYMHSLSPPVIHTNLTSRNVLLNDMKEAKISCFGTSPIRAYKSPANSKCMTLWTAPEVLCGKMYSTDVDMFAFGVILSELDMLSAPYSLARNNILNSTWRPLNDADILQKVSKGSLRVVFSEHGPMALAELGRACVSLDPLRRPTASQALCRLRTILSGEFA